MYVGGTVGVGVVPGVYVGVGPTSVIQKVPSITASGVINCGSPSVPSLSSVTSISRSLHCPSLPSADNVTAAKVMVPIGPGESPVHANMIVVLPIILYSKPSRIPFATLSTLTTAGLTVSIIEAEPKPCGSSVVIVISTVLLPPKGTSAALPIPTEVPGSASEIGEAANNSTNTHAKTNEHLFLVINDAPFFPWIYAN
jgi:hypothetical protein